MVGISVTTQAAFDLFQTGSSLGIVRKASRGLVSCSAQSRGIPPYCRSQFLERQSRALADEKTSKSSSSYDGARLRIGAQIAKLERADGADCSQDLVECCSRENSTQRRSSSVRCSKLARRLFGVSAGNRLVFTALGGLVVLALGEDPKLRSRI